MTTCVKWEVCSKTKLSHTLTLSLPRVAAIDEMTLPGTREYETVAGGGSRQEGGTGEPIKCSSPSPQWK